MKRRKYRKIDKPAINCDMIISISVTKIKQDRTNQDRTEIGPSFEFLLHFSIFLLELFSIASRLSCETMFKISCQNIKNFRRITKKGPIFVLYYHDRTKISLFFEFLLHYSMFLYEIFSEASQLTCSKFQVKILKTVEENPRKDQIWSYLDWSFLV